MWKNWCFQIVVLEKALLRVPRTARRSVSPKGYQPWIFIGRIVAEAEAPILWPPNMKSQLIGKDPGSGKDWRQKEKVSVSQCVSHSVQFSSVTRSCPILCNPMNHSTPGLPIHHQLPESTQTHVHGVGDSIQPSHPLLSPFPPTFNISQHQSLFKWVSSSHQMAKVLEFQLQHQSFQWIFRTDALGLTGWISLQSKGLSRVFSSTTVQKHQFFGTQPSL